MQPSAISSVLGCSTKRAGCSSTHLAPNGLFSHNNMDMTFCILHFLFLSALASCLGRATLLPYRLLPAHCTSNSLNNDTDTLQPAAPRIQALPGGAAASQAATAACQACWDSCPHAQPHNRVLPPPAAHAQVTAQARWAFTALSGLVQQGSSCTTQPRFDAWYLLLAG